MSLNLMRGCAHRCAFCSVRAHASYPGDGVVYLYSDTVDRLREELAARRQLPRAVYLSPSTDPFPPLAEVQAETGRVVAVLVAHGVETWLMTRGVIRPAALRVLATRAKQVRVTIGLTTLDRELQRLLEPLTAPPRLRLRQMGRLRELEIGVQVALEPLIPGLTDTRENLVGVLEALARAGVRHVSASYLFLRSGISSNLARALGARGSAERVLAAFRDGPLLAAGAIAPARYLPKARRQRGYASLMALAADRGITVSICGTTNPDFPTPRRLEAGPARQPLLPRFVEA